MGMWRASEAKTVGAEVATATWRPSLTQEDLLGSQMTSTIRSTARPILLAHDNDPNKSGHVIQKRNSQLKRAKRILPQSC